MFTLLNACSSNQIENVEKILNIATDFLVLDPNIKLKDPIKASKEISKIKGVVMLYHKEIPQTKQLTTT